MTHAPTIAILCIAPFIGWSIYRSVRNAVPMIEALNRQWREW